jgi:hypothetical protein
VPRARRNGVEYEGRTYPGSWLSSCTHPVKRGEVLRPAHGAPANGFKVARRQKAGMRLWAMAEYPSRSRVFERQSSRLGPPTADAGCPKRDSLLGDVTRLFGGLHVESCRSSLCPLCSVVSGRSSMLHEQLTGHDSATIATVVCAGAPRRVLQHGRASLVPRQTDVERVDPVGARMASQALLTELGPHSASRARTRFDARCSCLRFGARDIGGRP